MYCPSCGKETPDSSRFCNNCGYAFTPSGESGKGQSGQNTPNQRQQKNHQGTKQIVVGAAILLVAVGVIFNLFSRPKAGQLGNSNASTRQPQQTQAPKDDTKERTAEADKYFSRGDYDTALGLYRQIDTDYAKSKVHAIECIDVAEEISQRWLESVDPGIYNVFLAQLGSDFEFDTEYDVENYTFYTKMYYGDIYTAASIFLTDEQLSEGVTSVGHEKTTYEWFREQGYDDITCVFNSYGSNGKLWSTFSYGSAEYEADLLQERENSSGNPSGVTSGFGGSDYSTSGISYDNFMGTYYEDGIEEMYSSGLIISRNGETIEISFGSYRGGAGTFDVTFSPRSNWPQISENSIRFTAEEHARDETYDLMLTFVPAADSWYGKDTIELWGLGSDSLDLVRTDFGGNYSSDGASSSDYIFPNSSWELLTEADVRGMTDLEVNHAKNEIYARHGRRFVSTELQAYFDAKPWYYGTIEPEDFTEGMLSEIEKQNVSFLAGIESQLKSGG